ncbi:hypothetical protein OF83DRAFT_1103685 [Amylostereum chailletii]|nr:hypothetical protein OF83DRAFT_1103685 [Amylostereum chailletii]
MAPVTRPLPSPVHSVAEFVDDSEPEREEERKLWKEKKRHPKVTNRTPLHAEAAGSSRVAPFPSVKVVTPGFTSVIELSGGWFPAMKEMMAALVALSRASNAVSVPSVPSDLPSDEPFSPVRPMTLGIDIPDDEIDDDGSNLRLKLSRFAYSQESLKDRSGRSTPQSLRPSPAPAVASGSDLLPQPKGRRGRPLNPVMFFDLPESQASRLRKCVSCGIAWTTRKSAKNKVSHIRTCARKKGLRIMRSRRGRLRAALQRTRFLIPIWKTSSMVQTRRVKVDAQRLSQLCKAP